MNAIVLAIKTVHHLKTGINALSIKTIAGGLLHLCLCFVCNNYVVIIPLCADFFFFGENTRRKRDF